MWQMFPTKDQIRVRLHRWSQWDELRRVGNSGLVKLTVVIPIVGYMVLFNDKLHAYLSVDLFGLGSVSYRLYAFYFGFSFLGIASLLYQAFCPKLVRDYGSSAEWFAREGATVPPEFIDSLEQQHFQALFSDRLNAIGVAYADLRYLSQSALPNEKLNEAMALRDQMNRRIEKLEQSGDRKPFLMGWHFHPQISEKHRWRFAILSLYALGFAILSVPTVHTFFAVLASATSRVLEDL